MSMKMDDFFIPEESSSGPDDFFIPEQKRTKAQKAGRLASQFGLGLAESALVPYELGVAPLASKEAQMVPYRENVFADIERLQEQKQMGIWDDQDQALYDSLINQIKNPKEAEKHVRTADIGVRGLAEKVTGLDLHPEGVLEKAANWMGFIKNPANFASSVKNLAKLGFPAKDVLKAIAPGSSSLRSLGAATGLEMAEQGDFGPIGTISAAILGDLAGGGVAGAAKAISKPKESIAKLSAMMTPKDKLGIQKQLIQDFKEAGITADIGTITNSNLVKSMQAKLAQSGLTGRALDDLRKKMTDEVLGEYKKLADELGNYRFQTIHEASDIGREGLKAIRDAEKSRISSIYDESRKVLSPDAKVSPFNVASTIRSIQRDLAPGAVKSVEQKAVLDTLKKLEKDIFQAGKVKKTSVQDLINNKIALNDIINYEVQGGQKQLLKRVVKEIDDAISFHGIENPKFRDKYLQANREFTKHADIFRNDNMNRILTAQDPSVLMNKMNSVKGIKDIQRALGITGEGKQLFNDLKRFKLDQMIGNKMTDNVSSQLKLGTFSNLLKNPKDRQLALELLGPKAFAKLEKLQKATGKLAETANKFFNASKSGATIMDAAVVGGFFKDLSSILSGNPWPLLRTASGIGAGRYLTDLLGDVEFLKMVEEAVIASSKNNIGKLMQIGMRLEQPIKAALANVQSE